MIKLEISNTLSSLNRKRLTKTAIEILTTAQKDITKETLKQVPFKSGKLYNSYFTVRSGQVLTFGYLAKYAYIVHEKVGANFIIGKAKFLEDPVRSYIPIFRDICVKEVTKVVQSG